MYKYIPCIFYMYVCMEISPLVKKILISLHITHKGYTNYVHMEWILFGLNDDLAMMMKNEMKGERKKKRK